ncbi:MAG: adenylate kinase [Candidatus Gastranaerophilales bacterium]|nr:adenylate kinase [Candidatus Gastranaerophilales bacterium]
MKREFIFIGPPGSGKGTQTKMLSKEFNLEHIDTGLLLREAVLSGSEEGKLANSYMENGQLVPIEIVSSIIKNRLLKDDCKNGFILDGYPRSIEQAHALDDILADIDSETEVKLQVFYFEVAQEKLVERLVNRRSCSKCGAIYNLKTMKLKDETKCEKCSGELIRREDDTEEVANKRFTTYFEQTAPLIELYEKRGLLTKLDAGLSINEIYQNLKGAIKENVHS